MKLNRRNEPLMWRKPDGKTDWDKMLEVSHAQQRFEWTITVIIVWAFVVIGLRIFG